MAPQTPPQLHFVMFPLMSPGHMIPMMDLATILSQHNMIVTVVTTPHNASRFSQTFNHASQSGLQLRLVQLPFPSKDAGFPEGCENFDMLPSMAMGLSFFEASNNILHEPAEKVFEGLTPKPNCIISDMNVLISNVLEGITSDSEYFDIPGIPDKIEITKVMMTGPMNENWNDFVGKMIAAEMVSYGVVINSFEELEPAYVKDFKKAKNDKLWCVGPVSLRNKGHLDKGQRGNKASIDEDYCMKWLDMQKASDVIYVCLGSICNLTPLQLIELGMALEESKRPFVWVIRERNQSEELNKWIKESGFEERTKGKSLLIKGWAPQILILSHPSIGGFLTHCGWNSTLEAICAGVPMLTWPLFGDQFFNERFVVQILRVGVRVGVEIPVNWGEEETKGMLVKKEDVKMAIEKLLDEESESEERRKRARVVAEMAKRAVEEGGSSYHNVTLLIQDIMQQFNKE